MAGKCNSVQRGRRKSLRGSSVIHILPARACQGTWTHLDAHFHRNLRLFFDSGVKATSILPSTFVYTTSRASWSQTSDFTSRYFSVATGF
ncbi:hypothetical protein PCASD_12143 [Puccinia coronata f. sp. avenae]|uniref:Uncharacterized protein n=1 Tax=Puccinia coronata f. sp. avenae TaxID=200324 RepID=A0A2N5TBH3_9BASI|nr:hypothetical protein PCASD_12143 [Puccinia coronata f. sp. avenae]